MRNLSFHTPAQHSDFAFQYTAETRAKKRVIIVGDWDAVVRAIQTADTKRRHTMLAMRINELTKE